MNQENNGFYPNSHAEYIDSICSLGNPYPEEIIYMWYEENSDGEKRKIETRRFKLVEIKDGK